MLSYICVFGKASGFRIASNVKHCAEVGELGHSAAKTQTGFTFLHLEGVHVVSEGMRVAHVLLDNVQLLALGLPR